MNQYSLQTTAKARNAFSGLKIEELMPAIGTAVLRYGTVLFLVVFGTAKWTTGEAAGIQPMVAHNPFTFWLYRFLSVQGASIAIGMVELTLAAMIVTRRFLPAVSARGSALSILMFLTTLSFLITTPHLDEGTQGFLMKDLILLGAAIYTAGEAFRAARVRSGGAA